MGCGGSKPESGPKPPSQGLLKAQPQLPPGFYGNFAPTFKFYFTGRKKYKKTDFFAFVSDTGHGQVPFHAVTFHLGNLDHKKQVTLYAGTARDTQPLATAGVDKLFGSYAFMTLPGDTAGGGNRTETVVWPKGFTSLGFEIRVGNSHMLERFEWRGDNMMLAHGKDIKPWNLVRVRTDGGEEIVATWTELRSMAPSGEIGTFQFLGSGAAGELGPYWALMAVSSWLFILKGRWVLNRFMDQLVSGGTKLLFGGVGTGLGMI